VMQEMLEAEMTDALGAEKGERTMARLGYRSGYYTRTLVTRVGKLELRVPQDRDGRFSTELFATPSPPPPSPPSTSAWTKASKPLPRALSKSPLPTSSSTRVMRRCARAAS